MYAGPDNTIQADNYDEEDSTETDSCYGSEAASLAETLRTYWKNYKFVNGRRYAAHDSEGQIVPNDDIQQDQMDLFHHIAKDVMGDDLYKAPIDPKSQRILDLGTGTGIWAIEVADAMPSAQVIGTDVSPIQPEWVPPNCEFQVDDYNIDWTFTKDSFDFVHGRGLQSTINDLDAFIAQAFKVLKPGGWFEYNGEVAEVISNKGPEHVPKILIDWIDNSQKAVTKFGKIMRVDYGMEKSLEQAGFDMSTVSHKLVPMPIGAWAKDPILKRIGVFLLDALRRGLEGYMTTAYMTLGFSAGEIKKAHDEISLALGSRKNQLCLNYQITYAQKPLRR